MAAGASCECCAELALTESIARDFAEPSSAELSVEDIGCALLKRTRLMSRDDTRGVDSDTRGVDAGEWLLHVQRAPQKISQTQSLGLLQVNH